MPDYRRAVVPGGSYFFTVVVHQRRPLLADPRAAALLGSVFRRCQIRWPFTVNAIVLLPDHLHAIWSLPTGDGDYSKRWGWIKKEFTSIWLQLGGAEAAVSQGRQREGRRGIWQPRFWEHALSHEEDFERHFDYIHWNPVKHGHAESPLDWSRSSFHRYVRLGAYACDWGRADNGRPEMDFSDIRDRVGE